MSRPSALASFRFRSFRFQWPADLVTSWAFEMEALILGWYILVETGSAVLLTAFWSLLFTGTLLSPLFGVAGDRMGHRNLLFGMRIVYTVLAAVLTTLSVAGVITPIYVFIVAAFAGLVRPSDLGMRGALVAATLPHEHMVTAMSISRTTTDGARVVGALTGAGLFVAFGMGLAYVAITTFYALGALLTLGAGPEVRHRPAETADGVGQPSPWRDLKEGVVYVWTTPRLLALIWLAFLINLTAYPLLNGLLPYIAKDVYGVDQTGLGYLVASFAFGALLGSIGLTMAGDRYRMERVMIVSTIVWYGLLVAFGQAQGMQGGIVCLLLTGFVQSLAMVSLMVILMRTAEAKFRGRVMGVRMLAIYSLPLGMMAAGALVSRIGFDATATTYAVVGMLFTLIIAVRWRADIWQRPPPPKAV
jgi:MFS family permease